MLVLVLITSDFNVKTTNWWKNFSTTKGTQFNSLITFSWLGQTIKKEIFSKLLMISPQDIEILGWCPVMSILFHGQEVPLAFADHASHGGLIIKILYGVDVLLDQPALHYIFSYWVD